MSEKLAPRTNANERPRPTMNLAEARASGVDSGLIGSIPNSSRVPLSGTVMYTVKNSQASNMPHCNGLINDMRCLPLGVNLLKKQAG